MNIQEYSHETVFFISVFVAAIFGASVVLLAFRLFKGKKKTTPCVVVQDYLDSPLHAKVVALHIIFEKSTWLLNQAGKISREGNHSPCFNHLFLNSVDFEKEGLKVSMATRGEDSGVGNIYAPGRLDFAQRVAHILASEFSTRVVLRCNDGSIKNETILGNQYWMVPITNWGRGDLSGIG